jgi:hypothetical protein
MITPGARAAIAELNDIVRLDGGVLRVVEASSTAISLELDLSSSSCPECVVPKELLVDILTANLAKADPDVQKVHLHDPREEEHRVQPDRS